MENYYYKYMKYERIVTDDVISLKSLATLAGIPYIRAWRAVRSGMLEAPSKQCGGRFYYPADDIARLRKAARELK